MTQKEARNVGKIEEAHQLLCKARDILASCKSEQWRSLDHALVSTQEAIASLELTSEFSTNEGDE